MNDTSQDVNYGGVPISDREKELAERAGARMLIIWLLVSIIAIESIVIVHLVT
jgi:hypothetical protein